MQTVYVLWSDKLAKRYVGSTRNLKKRLHEHNLGQSRFTKGGIPWRVLYSESLTDLKSARQRENFLKSGVGRKWLDDFLK